MDNFKGIQALDDSELDSVSGGLYENYETISDLSPTCTDYIAKGICPKCGNNTIEWIGTGFWACQCGASYLVVS